MQEKERDIGNIYHSLKNSRIRDDTFNIVCNASEELSAREIAIKLGNMERNVLGALIGDRTRYKIEDSLESLGLIKRHEYNFHGYMILLFSATENGLQIYQQNKLKDYANKTKDSSLVEQSDSFKNDIEEGLACKE